MLKRRAFLNLSGARPAPADGYWQHISRAAMACRFEVTMPLGQANGVRVASAALQQIALIALRTLIGWHFLYEGYYKLMLPGWSAEGKPLAAWTSAGYLKAATGPLAPLLQWLVNKGWVGWMDGAIKISLLLIGLSLLLGLFTRLGCWGALLLLALFYVLAIPTSGSPQPGNEGTYLFVNKTLIEAAAVLVLLVFNTGAMAGLDLLWRSKKTVAASAN